MILKTFFKQQSKLIFNGTHKTSTICDSYTYKQNEVLLDEPIYLGFTVLELSTILMYGTYYNELQPYFDREKLQLHYMDTDSFILSVNTKAIIKDLKNFDDSLDFINLNENQEIFSNKNKK